MSNPAEEFKLKVSGTDHELTAVWSRPFDGTNERSATIEVDPLRLRTIDVLVGLLRRNRLLEDNELKLLGEHLFVTLFQTSKGTDNGPGALLRQAIKGKREPDESGERVLRVSLEFDSDNDKFASWPWEYLFVPPVRSDPDSDFFLSWSTKLVLTRRMSLNTTSREMHVQPPLKVLLAVLSPHGGGLVPVAYESVMNMFIDLRDSEPAPRIRLWVFSPGHALDGTPYPPDTDDPERTSYPAFADVVSRFNPHVIHIIGHGRYVQRGDQGAYGQLAFPKDHTEPQWVNDWEIATELMENDELRLVFFQACETAATSSHPYQAISGMAHSLAQKNIPAVIGMHFQVKSAVANKFAREFYQPLMQHKPIEVAMHAGRRALRLGRLSESEGRNFGMPVLYLREYSPLLVAHSAPATSKTGGFSIRASESPAFADTSRFELQRPGEPLGHSDEHERSHRGTGRISGERNSA